VVATSDAACEADGVRSVLDYAITHHALESLTGEKISVGAPFYNLTFGPLFLPILLAMPFGPLLAWKRGDLLGAAQRLIVAYVAGTAVALLMAALRGGLPMLAPGQLRQGDARTATEALQREPTPQTLLVDISGIAEPFAALEALAAVCAPDVRVLVVGEQTDIGFYRQLTRDLCVAEYAHKPLTRDVVARLFGPLLGGAPAEASRGGKVIAVAGMRGGCGATTVAVNLALQLAERSHGHVALLDLHLRGGTTGLMLGVRPGTGLRVALEEPDRVDALFLDRAGDRHTLTGECAEETAEGAFWGIREQAEHMAGGPVRVVASRFYVVQERVAA
jgi:hypothetical protein